MTFKIEMVVLATAKEGPATPEQMAAAVAQFVRDAFGRALPAQFVDGNSTLCGGQISVFGTTHVIGSVVQCST